MKVFSFLRELNPVSEISFSLSCYDDSNNDWTRFLYSPFTTLSYNIKYIFIYSREHGNELSAACASRLFIERL